MENNNEDQEIIEEPLDDQTIIKTLKTKIVWLIATVIILSGIVIYERIQVHSCRSLGKAFVSDLSAAFTDDDPGYESTQAAAQWCNSFPN